MRMAVLMLASLMTSGCGTTKPQQTPDRPWPTMAMQPCPAQLCVAPKGADQLPLDAQAQVIDACRLEDAEKYRECERKQRELVEWIRAAKK